MKWDFEPFSWQFVGVLLLFFYFLVYMLIEMCIFIIHVTADQQHQQHHVVIGFDCVRFKWYCDKQNTFLQM